MPEKSEKFPRVRWLSAPEEHDYPAAAAYLSLLAPSSTVEALVKELRSADSVTHAAKDLLRASRLPLLPLDNAHVASDLDKIRAKKSLSPVLVVRGDAARNLPALIADGYHRVCASYHADENTPIPVHIAEAPVGAIRP